MRFNSHRGVSPSFRMGPGSGPSDDVILWFSPCMHAFDLFQEPERQYMHIGTMVEFAYALVGKLDAINKHSFNDFKLRVGMLCKVIRATAKLWEEE